MHKILTFCIVRFFFLHKLCIKDQKPVSVLFSLSDARDKLFSRPPSCFPPTVMFYSYSHTLSRLLIAG